MWPLDTYQILGGCPINNRIIHIIWAGVIAITLALVCVCVLNTVSRHTLEQAWDDSHVPVCRGASGHRLRCD